MKVQSIQTTQTTNNCRKPCFKAHFVQDSKGIFNNLWANVSKNDFLEKQIMKLANEKPDHALEFISSHDIFYTVLNHFNGKVKEYYTDSRSNNLNSVLIEINEDEELFKDYEYSNMSEVFRILTGQEKPKEKITITDDGKLITEKH